MPDIDLNFMHPQHFRGQKNSLPTRLATQYSYFDTTVSWSTATNNVEVVTKASDIAHPSPLVMRQVVDPTEVSFGALWLLEVNPPTTWPHISAPCKRRTDSLGFTCLVARGARCMMAGHHHFLCPGVFNLDEWDEWSSCCSKRRAVAPHGKPISFLHAVCKGVVPINCAC